MTATVVRSPVNTGEFTGYAAAWSLDREGDTIVPGAFANSVRAINAGSVSVPIMAGNGHRDLGAEVVVGRVVEAKEDNHGLWIRAVYADDEFSQTIRRKVMSGALSMSILGSTLDARETSTGKEISAIDLINVLLTSAPMNPGAIILTAKTMTGRHVAVPRPKRDIDVLIEDMLAENTRSRTRSSHVDTSWARQWLAEKEAAVGKPLPPRGNPRRENDAQHLAWRKFLRGVR